MLLSRPPPQATLFPYTTLFRSEGSRKRVLRGKPVVDGQDTHACLAGDETTGLIVGVEIAEDPAATVQVDRSEEHTSELQSPCNLVCRLLLEKKKYTASSRATTR